MSSVSVLPDLVAAAASDLAGIGSPISAANAAAMLPATGGLAAAEERCR